MVVTIAIYTALITLLSYRYFDKYMLDHHFDWICKKAYKCAAKHSPTHEGFRQLRYEAYIFEALSKYYSLGDKFCNSRIDASEIYYKNFEVERTLDNL